MTPAERADLVCQLALDAGFDHVGIAPAQPIARLDYVNHWLDRGWAGEMDYLRRHRDLRADPRRLLDGARSIVVVAHNYHHLPAKEPAKHSGPPGADAERDRMPRGRIAQYAWGRDYHRVVRKKLHRLADALRARLGEPVDSRVCVDTAPLLEREAAAAAGIGWIGKNTMGLNAELGSFFFLGAIITTLELAPSALAADRCGSCTRCLDACPTGALVAPYQMDASRCIAYLTIEHRGEVPDRLQPLVQDWVFGCDLCQNCCPHNRNAPAACEPAYDLNDRNSLPPHPPLLELMDWTADQYRRHLAGSAMKRATLAMLQRNARTAYRNWQCRQQKNDATGSSPCSPIAPP